MDYSSFEIIEEEKQAGSPTPKLSRAVRLILKGLSIVLIILLLPFVTRYCLPLLKPVGESMLQRLWDVLRFIVITTAVSFGILNSQWKAIERADSSKDEDGQNRRAPLLNNSIFNEMEHLKGKEYFANDFHEESPNVVRPVLQAPDNEGVSKIQCETYETASSPGIEKLAVALVEEEFHTKVPFNTATGGETSEYSVGYRGNIHSLHEADLDFRNRNALAAATDESAVGSSTDHLPGEAYSRGLIISPNNEGLTAVTETNFYSTCVSKERPILHRRIAAPPSLNREKSRRRSSSVDRPVQRQSSRVSISADEDGSRAVLDPIVKTPNLVVSPRNSRSALNLGQLNENEKPARPSRRYASFSCDFGDGSFNLDQLKENEQLARSSRRHTSFSCDFGDDYSPEWLIEYPSDSEPEAPSPIAKAICSPSANGVPRGFVPQGQSSPVDIAPTTNSSDSHSPRQTLAEELRSTSVSPSPNELNRKADAFIARFHEQMRLQRVESIERRRSNLRSIRRGYNY